jgi:hypothetical protein
MYIYIRRTYIKSLFLSCNTVDINRRIIFAKYFIEIEKIIEFTLLHGIIANELYGRFKLIITYTLYQLWKFESVFILILLRGTLIILLKMLI